MKRLVTNILINIILIIAIYKVGIQGIKEFISKLIKGVINNRVII